MIVQWYPGHMAKTLKEIEKNLKLSSVVIYCLDARVPFSSLNPKIDEIVGGKPVIYVLNKADLADDNATKKVVKLFEKQGKTVIACNANSNQSKAVILKTLKDALQQKLEKFQQKGINGVLRAMVVGVPNTGKSTIINLLCGSKKAITGNKAGVTRQASWVKIGDNIELMDTPGTLWPKFEDELVGIKLAIVGSIKDDVVDVTELGFACMKLLIEIAPTKLIERYKLSFGADEIKQANPVDVLNEICVNRGFVLKKNEMDYERAGKAILDDFRNCRIGKITLDLI